MKPQKLTPEMVAFDFLANRFTDLAAAFARRDGPLAAAFLNEAEQRIAAHLHDLLASFRAKGMGEAGANVLVPAAEMLRAVILEAKAKSRQPPQ